MLALLILSTALSLVSACTLTGDDGAMLRLRQCLFERYDRQTHPGWPQGAQTLAIVGPWLDNIVDVDDQAHRIHLSVWMPMQWYDARLTWNVSDDIAGTDADAPLYVAETDIWRPSIDIRQRLQRRARTPQPDALDYFFTRVSSDGRVYTSAYFNEPWTCKMRTRRFPFDRQVCHLTLFSSGDTALQAVGAANQSDRNYSSDILAYSDTRQAIDYYQLYTSINGQTGFDTGEWAFDQYSMLVDNGRRATCRWSAWNESYLTLCFPLVRSGRRHAVVWLAPTMTLALAAPLDVYFGSSEMGTSTIVTLTLLLVALNERLPDGDDGVAVISVLYLGVGSTVIVGTLLLSLSAPTVAAIWPAVPLATESKERKRLVTRRRRAILLLTLGTQVAVIAYALSMWLFTKDKGKCVADQCQLT